MDTVKLMLVGCAACAFAFLLNELLTMYWSLADNYEPDDPLVALVKMLKNVVAYGVMFCWTHAYADVPAEFLMPHPLVIFSAAVVERLPGLLAVTDMT